MAKRYPYDLGHLCFNTIKIGRVQTLSLIPVVAGDSIGLDLNGALVMSPLRRQITLDAQVDIIAVYRPHRHAYARSEDGLTEYGSRRVPTRAGTGVYGKNEYLNPWMEMLREGSDVDITATGLPAAKGNVTFPHVTNNAIRPYLGTGQYAGDLPLWVVSGYNEIWNHYFRVPTEDGFYVGYNYLPPTPTGGDFDENYFGFNAGRLPSIWSTGTRNEVTSGDHQVDIESGGSKLDLVKLEQSKARFHDERSKEWFAQTYDQVMEKFGSGVNGDTDDRPELLFRRTFYTSGRDVDGTDDATLGSFVGRGYAPLRFAFPKRYFSEHGAIWVMMVVRYPTIHADENHYLYNKPNFTYNDIVGDPDFVSVQPPQVLAPSAYLSGKTSRHTTPTGSDQMKEPYGQWYRFHPNMVHPLYNDLQGYPFEDVPINSSARAWYHGDLSQFDAMFHTTQLGHGSVSAKIDVLADRVVPGPKSSIFTGTT